MKKLFLLDAFALIYRSYFAFSKNPRVNSKGFNTSAAYGFTTTLIDLIKKENPTHLAVVFDTPEPTQRHIEYTEYKAQREAMPEDIASNIPIIQSIVEAMNIPMYGIPGYEADDIIGTLAKKAAKSGFEAYMMTPDKDYAQLVEDHVYMYRPGRGGKGPEVLGIPEVCEKFGIENPLQVIDILGLMGDAVDNIPGVPGVGEKTAQKLISQYGSIEGLYENTHELKGKMKEKVEANHEQALLSKRLATIILDVPVELNEEELEINEPNKEALKELFSELEFRTLAQRYLGEKIEVATASSASSGPDLFSVAGEDVEEAPTEFKTIATENANYQLVDSDAKWEKLLKELHAAPAFCFDTETTGLDVFSDKILGLAISTQPKTGWYIPLLGSEDEKVETLAKLKEVMLHPDKVKVAHNIKYDLAILKRYGVEVKHHRFDTMLAHYLINADMRHGMDVLAETYLKYQPVGIEELIGKKGKNQLSMDQVDIEKVKDYAAEDADITFQLYQLFDKELREIKGYELFEQLEMPLVEVLMDMEAEGINLDVQALKDYSKQLLEQLQELEGKIYEEAGAQFTISSPKQLGEILFDQLKIVEKPKKTKTGQYATGEEVLAKLRDSHPIVDHVLTFRELLKLRSTYVEALPKLIHPNTNHIHTSYNQAVASTGRLSSNNPNLQNIPIRRANGREVRKAFIPRNNDYVLFSADYSQVELRIIAALAEEKNMIQAFQEGLDIHTATAAKVFGVSVEEVDREMRSKAKAVNFGIVYGQSAFGLSQQLGIKRGEAKEIIDNYFAQYPGIKTYMENTINTAREKGYVETLMGRRKVLADINSRNATVRGFAERNAINAPIQGSAADIIKKAMIDVHAALKESSLQSKMLLQVHDELVFDALKTEVEDLKTLVTDKMQHAVTIAVPLLVETGMGANWLEAH